MGRLERLVAKHENAVRVAIARQIRRKADAILARTPLERGAYMRTPTAPCVHCGELIHYSDGAWWHGLRRADCNFPGRGTKAEPDAWGHLQAGTTPERAGSARTPTEENTMELPAEWSRIGAAMVGPMLIGQPARVQHKGGGITIEKDITGVRIERDAYPAVSINGALYSLDEWDVFVNIPPDLEPANPNASSPEAAAGTARQRVDLIINPDLEGPTGIVDIDLPPGIEIRAHAGRNPKTGRPEARVTVTTPSGRAPFGVGETVIMRTVD